MKKLFAPLLGIVLIVALAYVWFAPSGASQAPDFSITTLDGKKINKQSLVGKPALITFWATSCVSCVAEQPHLNALYEKYAAQGFNLIAIAMDFDPIEQVKNMRQTRQLIYPISHDSNGTVARAFGDVRLTPTNILLSPDGRILFQKLGEVDFALLDQQIKGLL